jgi:hypothetical protein
VPPLEAEPRQLADDLGHGQRVVVETIAAACLDQVKLLELLKRLGT